MQQPNAFNLRAGYHLRTFDLDPARLKLLERGAQVTPVSKVEDIATPGGIVLSAVSDDQAIRHNIEALSPVLAHGFHLGLSTIAPQTARWAEATYQQAGLGTTYLSANMVGRPTLAEVARLSIFLSGLPTARERVLPLLRLVGVGSTRWEIVSMQLRSSNWRITACSSLLWKPWPRPPRSCASRGLIPSRGSLS